MCLQACAQVLIYPNVSVTFCSNIVVARPAPPSCRRRVDGEGWLGTGPDALVELGLQDLRAFRLRRGLHRELEAEHRSHHQLCGNRRDVVPVTASARWRGDLRHRRDVGPVAAAARWRRLGNNSQNNHWLVSTQIITLVSSAWPTMIVAAVPDGTMERAFFSASMAAPWCLCAHVVSSQKQEETGAPRCTRTFSPPHRRGTIRGGDPRTRKKPPAPVRRE